MILINCLHSFNLFSFNFKKIKSNLINNFLFKTYFIWNYYMLNELIWQEGFLIDFLQKKIVNNWMKKFLIFSTFLFNERLIFDKIIKFYLNLIMWPMHKLFIFEFNNMANTLLIIIFFFVIYMYLIGIIMIVNVLSEWVKLL